MKCPKCNEDLLEEINVNDVKVDYCKSCGGLWFDRDELRIVRDHRDENLSWLDFDLWENENKLVVSGKSVDCPRDGKPLFKIKYQNTDVMIDVCLECRGVWLDKDELNKIISALKEKVNSETIPQYLRDLGGEIKELISHPSEAKIELRHIMILMKLMEYRLVASWPKILEITSALPH